MEVLSISVYPQAIAGGSNWSYRVLGASSNFKIPTSPPTLSLSQRAPPAPPEIMAPKKAREAASTTAQTNVAAHTTASSAASTPLAAVIPTPKTTGSATWDKVLVNLYNHYVDQTAQRVKLLDVFLAFLVAVGALQFFYCVLVGNFVRSAIPWDRWQTEGGAGLALSAVDCLGSIRIMSC